MFDRYTEEARRVIFWARGHAGRHGAEAIGSEHLLLGFLSEDGGDSADAMGTPRAESFFAADTAEALRVAFDNPDPSAVPIPPSRDMPLSEAGRRVLEEAGRCAGGGKITPLHLLFALAGDEHTRVSAELSRHGATAAQVLTHVRAKQNPRG